MNHSLSGIVPAVLLWLAILPWDPVFSFSRSFVFSRFSVEKTGTPRQGYRPSGHSSSSSSSLHSPITRLTFLRMSGDGIAQTYTWHEEAFEIEVSVTVPKETRAKDIQFKATSTSIDLRLIPRPKNEVGVSTKEQLEPIVLLDKSRPLRGRVSLDGTFWVLSDPIPSSSPSGVTDGESYRRVTVTIEKQIRHARDDFDVIEYDWKGLYANEDDGEVSYRKYDEAEELNVREYAASLGVDIDNLNMSLVDKSMFTSGLNLTKSSLDSLQEAGLMKEVTRQSDGSEWIIDEDGERQPFDSLGGTTSPSQKRKTPATIPFLDTDSPWHEAIPVERDHNSDELRVPVVDMPTEQERMEMETTTKLKTTTTTTMRKEKMKQLQKQREDQASDPIETLTVTRLKEILKSRGLKVSGNKRELQQRLRSEVNAMLNHGDTTKDPDTGNTPASA